MVFNLEGGFAIISRSSDSSSGDNMGTLRWIGTLLIAIVSLIGSVSILAQPVDLTQLTVTDAAKLIKEGRITSEELTRALLAKIASNPELNVFVTVNESGAINAARRG